MIRYNTRSVRYKMHDSFLRIIIMMNNRIYDAPFRLQIHFCFRYLRNIKVSWIHNYEIRVTNAKSKKRFSKIILSCYFRISMKSEIIFFFFWFL